MEIREKLNGSITVKGALQLALALAGALTVFGGVYINASKGVPALQADVKDHEGRLIKVETQFKDLRTDVRDIKTDVRELLRRGP